MAAELTIVLSGHILRPESADLRPFWLGFIELQKKLPATKPVRQIVVHSWNPELAPLAREVYAPQVERHENQACFYPEFIWQINPPDRFEKGVVRLTSTWKNVSMQSLLGNARSRSRAVKLMDELQSCKGQVLITRWDLGQTGSAQVNQLVADAALPEDYIYLSYFSEVDEGYADMWVLAPWADARRFGHFDSFVLESLTGKNRYLNLFSEEGWPRAREKTSFEKWRSHPLGQRIYKLMTKIVCFVQNYSLGDALPYRVIRRLTGSLQRFLLQPPVTAENSCLPNMRPPKFPKFLALNIHALLKFFILSEGVRDRVRFLTHEDFEITLQSGQLINPKPIVLVIHDAGDAEMAHLLSDSPLPLAAAYQMSEGNLNQYIPDGKGSWAVTALRAASSFPRDQMTCALDAELLRDAGTSPVLIVPKIEFYFGCTDWFYMNALMKYLVWRKMGYVGLENSRSGRPHLEFPGLEMVRGGGFSLRLAAGTVDGIKEFLISSDPELVEVCERVEKMQLDFIAVAQEKRLF